MLQAAGLRYLIDGSQASGKRVLKAEVMDKNGQYSPLRAKKRYIVVVPSYLAEGGDFFVMLTHGKRIASPEPVDADLLAKYLSEHNPLSQPQSGRLVRK